MQQIHKKIEGNGIDLECGIKLLVATDVIISQRVALSVSRCDDLTPSVNSRPTMLKKLLINASHFKKSSLQSLTTIAEVAVTRVHQRGDRRSNKRRRRPPCLINAVI